MSALDLTGAVEAGARVVWDASPGPVGFTCPWESASPVVQHEIREALLPIISAAAPLIAAQVRVPGPLRVEVDRLLAEFDDPTVRREITLPYIESRLRGAALAASFLELIESAPEPGGAR